MIKVTKVLVARHHGDVVVGPDVDKDGVPTGRPASGTRHVAGVRTYGKGGSVRVVPRTFDGRPLESPDERWGWSVMLSCPRCHSD